MTPPPYVDHIDLFRDTLSIVPQLIDAGVSSIVGVARSGMIPASILATHLHMPLYSMTQREIIDCGHGYRLKDQPRIGRAAIVDDTLMTGRSLRLARKIADQHWPDRVHVHIYSNPDARGEQPDIVARQLPSPHILDWNLFDSIYVARAAFDFDGVFCRDFTREEVYDEERYLETLNSMVPLHLPRREPVKIVTARLEKYREPTMAWLDRHGVQVASMIMGPWLDTREQDRVDVAAWKAEHLNRMFRSVKRSGFTEPIYVESCPRLSQRIAELTGALVVCPPAKKCYRRATGSTTDSGTAINSRPTSTTKPPSVTA